ncbi:MAG: hypothetical protein PVF45_11125 [Anaerolineae bacterium]|jgi:hypothetical protein
MGDKPRPHADHGVIRDRFALNPKTLFRWVAEHFDITTPQEAEARITEIDALAELIVVDGENYQIPHECYLGIGLEWDDDRPQGVVTDVEG